MLLFVHHPGNEVPGKPDTHQNDFVDGSALFEQDIDQYQWSGIYQGSVQSMWPVHHAG